MADAIPSSPGRIDPAAGKMEINIPRGEKLVKKDNGDVVRRTEFQSGTFREVNVFPGDHPEAQPLVEPKAEPVEVPVVEKPAAPAEKPAKASKAKTSG